MEAELGRDKLFPARQQRLAPLPAFEAIHAAHMEAWDGPILDPRPDEFVRDICARLSVLPTLARRWSRGFAVVAIRAYKHVMNHPRISITPGVMGGKPCVKGTRIPVDLLLDYLASGETVERLLEGYPALTAEDISAVLRFAADHVRSQGFVAV